MNLLLLQYPGNIGPIMKVEDVFVVLHEEFCCGDSQHWCQAFQKAKSVRMVNMLTRQLSLQLQHRILVICTMQDRRGIGKADRVTNVRDTTTSNSIYS